ncbi:MAG TPA: class I SAM-dependent methyltransferase [Bacteroidota bacterium]|nr:class I SAM-dependent methyltransferase [Bacteroidota bacterium]
MTDERRNIPMNVPAFYDALAPEYDEMTGFGKRFVHEKPFFRLLVENHGIATALDAGCGTGFHALLLAQLGVRVTAVDVSNEMLGRLERHGKEMDLSVRGVRSDFLSLRDAVAGPFDAVFCMGNTLPHLLHEADVRTALGNFLSLTAPGGLLFLQILNYDRILATRERILGAREINGVTYVRFYDFDDSGGPVLFNVLRLEKKEQELRTGLITVPLLPLTSGCIIGILEQCGYRRITTFGSIAMDPFHPAQSKDLVILATPQ